jgi:mRNA-degrading endonuclease toxin of MazEF toxin-antitoxin module
MQGTKLSDRYRAMAADARCEANAAEWISGLASCKAMAMSAQIVTADKLRLKSKLVELSKLGMQAVDDAVGVQLGLRK